MVGSAILRALVNQGQTNIVVVERSELDLIKQNDVKNFFNKVRPDHVYLAAAKVGGIYANNNFPAEFIYENLMIESNVIHSSFLSGVKKLLFLGSSCIYPKFAEQPIKEQALLTGSLEPTNEPYAIAKIAGVKLCENYNRQYGKSHGVDFRSIMPTNLYGPGDNYHPQNSHVIPALIYRFHEAKVKGKSKVVVWGTGSAKREFLYIDDLVSACIYVMNLSQHEYYENICSEQKVINVGSGFDISIQELAIKIKKIIGYKGIIEFDYKKPDGTPRKLLDSKIINNLGWKPKVCLSDGLIRTYNDFIKSK